MVDPIASGLPPSRVCQKSCLRQLPKQAQPPRAEHGQHPLGLHPIADHERHYGDVHGQLDREGNRAHSARGSHGSKACVRGPEKVGVQQGEHEQEYRLHGEEHGCDPTPPEHREDPGEIPDRYHYQRYQAKGTSPRRVIDE